jgi:hypothetical protein
MADDPAGPAAALRIRFEVPRSEVDRARSEAASEDFDRNQLRGKVHFDLQVPFEHDPVLEFLRERRGLALPVPLTVTLDQPVGYVVGHLAAATVMAAHGEPSPMVVLSGGAGALGIAHEAEGTLALSLPLERYAGVALVPTPDAARAVGAAARALTDVLDREVPVAAKGPFGRFLARETAILDALARRPAAARPLLEPLSVEFSRMDALLDTAAALERDGAHVVPYWAARLDGDLTRFEPLRGASRSTARGALGLAITADGARPLLASVTGAPDLEAALRRRLARPSPFAVVPTEGGPSVLRIEEYRSPPDLVLEEE